MGPDNSNLTGEVWAEFNGEKFLLGPIEDIDTKSLQLLTENIVRGLDETEVSFTGYIQLKRMSRKKFIKKMMAYGWDRNSAAGIAYYVQRCERSYASFFFKYVIQL